MNLPNKLTLLRGILVPFFVFFILLEGGNNLLYRYVGLGIFCFASFTDFLDGYLARKNHLVTNFGKFMDPLADKLLVCSALICLIPLGELPAWYVVILIGREFVISGFRLVAADHNIVIAASIFGKAKTASQMLMIILLLLQIPALAFLNQIFIVLSLVLTVLSLVDYVYKNHRVISEGGF